MTDAEQLLPPADPETHLGSEVHLGPNWLVLNGAEQYFEVLDGEYLPADEDAPPTLVYLHGGPGYNSASFAVALGERLEALPNPVVLLDQRGCGRSAPLDESEQGAELDIDTLAADLEALREHLGADRLVPLGHGFGALVALEYARRFPDRCARVIAVSPWLHFPMLALTLLAEAAALKGVDLQDPAGEVRANAPEDVYPQVGAARIQAAFELLNARDLLNALQFRSAGERMQLEFMDAETQLAANAEVAETLVERGMWEFEYPAFLPEISRPVFAIAGLHDHTSYPEQTEWLVDLCNADLTVLDAGHYPWLSDEGAFMEALEDCLQR